MLTIHSYLFCVICDLCFSVHTSGSLAFEACSVGSDLYSSLECSTTTTPITLSVCMVHSLSSRMFTFVAACALQSWVSSSGTYDVATSDAEVIILLQTDHTRYSVGTGTQQEVLDIQFHLKRTATKNTGNMVVVTLEPLLQLQLLWFIVHNPAHHKVCYEVSSPRRKREEML